LHSSAVNFCKNPAPFIPSLSRLPTFPLACAGSAHPAAPTTQTHTLRPVSLHTGGGFEWWVLPVVSMAVEIYNSYDLLNRK